ncbi:MULTISPECIES: hypothetical protein [Clostridia]|uniref:hypothetical protein n=1 Tax=Clostridia TaxID=186801 RepID=UPI002A8DA8C6|nr:hypothetical protein [Peptostreptococcus porci]MDY5098752.1 hypothetical protein [Clostridium sp.]MDY5437528.1 hypothetical protein [Peptostreptococcus porci]
MNKLTNKAMRTLRKQNKKFATIINKPVKPRKKKSNDNKEVQEVNIAVYYVIFWLIIAYLSFNTLF